VHHQNLKNEGMNDWSHNFVFKDLEKMGVVIHAYNSSTQEAEAGRS
jgi:hypothetical protein